MRPAQTSSASRPAVWARLARRSRYTAARMISIDTTGAVISTNSAINTSWITSRDWVTEKYTIDATRMQPAPMVIYIVREGDQLWEIAKKYKSTVDAIIEINQLAEENPRPGQKLLILK